MFSPLSTKPHHRCLYTIAITTVRSVRGVLGHDYSEAAEHTITHTLVTIKCEFEYVGHGDERLAMWQAGGVRR